MKAMVAGCFKMSGQSKTGNKFDMCVIRVLRPSESFVTDKIHCTAYGYESVDLQLDPEALPQFAQLQYPMQLDLQVEEKLTRKGIESYVIGVHQAQK